MTKRKKILLVDDFEFFLKTTELILKDKYDIILARSGEEAIGFLIDGNFPDLILLDIAMPDMDGWVTFNRLKELSSGRNIPIVFLTSMSGAAEEKYAYDSGVADFITKPYKKSDFVNRVDRIINMSE